MQQWLYLAELVNGKQQEIFGQDRKKNTMVGRRRLLIPIEIVLFLISVTGLAQTSKTIPDAHKKPIAIANLGNASRASAIAPLSTKPILHAAISAALIEPPEVKHPESLFDSISDTIKPITTTIEVRDGYSDIGTGEPAPFQVGGEEIINSAGTFGDISRWVQLMPGVVPTSDLSNEILVRGGHPMENLFLVDGIVVPNINHLSAANTTGGLAPMIDAAAVQSLKLYTGGYEARYPERLSSVTAVRTLDPASFNRRFEGDLGIQGLGGIEAGRLFGGDMLVSAHHGLLDMVSSNVGMDGVPSYTNELSRYSRSNSEGDHLTLLNLTGWDSISITPCASNTTETSSINSQYKGWRTTTGGEWQHVYTAHSFGVLGFSDSEQIEHIHQQDQIAANPLNPGYPRVACPIRAGVVNAIPVYQEDSNAGSSSASYGYEWATTRLALTAGSSAWLQRPHYNVAQPIGAFSPYSAGLDRADSASFVSNFSTGETGTYSQFTMHLWRGVSLSAGGRMQTFAFGNHMTFTPRLSAGYRFGEYAGIHIAYANYAQMPAYATMLAYPINRSMEPMRSSHMIVGMDLSPLRSSQLRIEAYRKKYTDVPSSTEYPSVTLNTMVNMLASEVVWLPMQSRGHGDASGIELSGTSRYGSRLQIQASVAYSRTKFAGTDGTLRSSNYDFPWIVNGAAVYHLSRGFILSGRYGFASGRPYTPFNLAASRIQNRPIYDLSLENSLRAGYYGRLDAQLSKEIKIYSTHLEIYGGVDNIFNRSNFLSFAWMPRSNIANKQMNPVATLWQMPIFPNFGVRVILR